MSSKRPIVFLGGVFTPRQIKLVVSESRGVIQNAADALQKNLIGGLAAHGRALSVVNLPFVGSYPRRFARPRFPGTRETLFSTVPLVGESFLLVRGIKPGSRMISAFRGLVRTTGTDSAVVLIYSAHLPFMTAALLYRRIRQNVRVCMVLPDFPEFMGEGSFAYRVAKSVESRLFYAMARHVDGFVVLTRAMADRLGLDEGHYTVVEGVAEDIGEFPAGAVEPAPDRCVFMYSGTLAARYGVMDLVGAFQQVEAPNAELWICGSGDSQERIQAAASADARIRYLGQVSRQEVHQLQRTATVLVNPRSPAGEFTKYSFPSKTMEYMASGRPVLMYHLPGVPDDYLPYFIQPRSAGAAGLKDAIEELMGWDASRLSAFGARARAFVLREKNAVVQCQKIVDLIDSLA